MPEPRLDVLTSPARLSGGSPTAREVGGPAEVQASTTMGVKRACHHHAACRRRPQLQRVVRHQRFRFQPRLGGGSGGGGGGAGGAALAPHARLLLGVVHTHRVSGADPRPDRAQTAAGALRWLLVARPQQVTGVGVLRGARVDEDPPDDAAGDVGHLLVQLGEALLQDGLVRMQR
jgi:hypothetical protein